VEHIAYNAAERNDEERMQDTGAISLIEQLYRTHYTELYRYVLQTMGDAQQAEDIVQQAFLVAAKRPEELMKSPKPIGWIYRTAQNIMKNTQRSMVRMQLLITKLLQMQPEHTVSMLHRDSTLFLRDIICPEEFELLKAFYLDGYSYMELAQRYQISLSACKMRIFRAKQRLSKALMADREREGVG